MKTLIIVLSVFLAVNSLAKAQEVPPQKEAQKATYTCPMHPDEMSSDPGKCAKCGMDMIKTTEKKYKHAVKGSQAGVEIVTKYVCPMDGTTSDKPGKCPKCGMDMTKTEIQKATYTCPMHPNELSSDPGKCAKCGMEMVKTTEKKYKHAVKGSQAGVEIVTKYVCKMDSATSDKPGKCPKCGMDMTKTDVQQTTYNCSMHPNEVSSDPGKCSKCGMEMIKTTEKKYNHAVKGSQAGVEIVTKYVCKMDSTTSDKPEKCPKCGTDLIKAEVQKVTYTCPMHPNEVSSDPGKCPSCGKEMVKTTKRKHNPAIKGSQTSRKVVTEYVCKMDGETSDKPGKCPKCGMEMTKTKGKKK